MPRYIVMLDRVGDCFVAVREAGDGKFMAILSHDGHVINITTDSIAKATEAAYRFAEDFFYDRRTN